jgi:hypothetical protein
MKSELTPGWNVFKQIFHDHWDEFKQFNPRYDTAYYDELVNKMLHIPAHLVVRRLRCILIASRSQDLQAEHPIWRW